jgi:hypothetical protein
LHLWFLDNDAQGAFREIFLTFPKTRIVRGKCFRKSNFGFDS